MQPNDKADACSKASRAMPSSSRLFFVLASLHAGVILPATVFGMLAPPSWMSSMSGATHGREMISGFVLALIAGYMLGAQPARWLCVLLILWCLGRLGLFLPEAQLTKFADPVFGLVLLARVLPRLGAAKKWRNKALPLILGTLCATPVLLIFLHEIHATQALHSVLMAVVLLLGLLLSFMGGRILAPAFAGAHRRAGRELQARVQPNLEASLIVILPAALILLPQWPTGSGGLAILAGIIVTIRLLRWRPWECAARPDLIALSVGYAWVAFGLVAVGHALMSARSATVPMHVLTVGAIGSLSIGVMGRVLTARCNTRPSHLVLTTGASMLTSVAMLLRVCQPFPSNFSLAIAAAFWSSAYVLMLYQLLAHEPLIARMHSGRER